MACCENESSLFCPQGITPQQLGVLLFEFVYAEVSAVYRPDTGALRLFDTYAPDALKMEWPDGVEPMVFSNHPTGDMEPGADDRRNAALLPAGARLFIVCERACVEAR